MRQAGFTGPIYSVNARRDTVLGERAYPSVAALPEDYREVVILADMENLSYQEIADRLQIPVGTVRSRLNRGRKRVQRALFSWRGGDVAAATAAAMPSARAVVPA